MKGTGIITSRFLRVAFSLVALVVVLLASYVSLGRVLIPGIAEYHDDVEARLSAALGQPVRLGMLSGKWQRLSPVIELQDLEVGEDHQALHLERVRVVPDVFSSVLHQEPRIGGVDLEGIRLTLAEQADGRWQVVGLPTRQDKKKPFDPGPALIWMSRFSQVNLQGGQLTLIPQQGKTFSVRYVEATLRTSPNGDVRLDGRASLPDGQPLALNIQGHVEASRWSDSRLRGYLSLPQTDWAQWIPGSLTRQWRLDELHAGGELWLEWENGALAQATARLNASSFMAAYGNREPMQLSDIALDVAFGRDTSGWHAVGSNLAVSMGERRWSGVTLAVQRDEAAQAWHVRADRLNLVPLSAAVQSLAPLPEQAADIITALQPQGALRNIRIDYFPTRPKPQQLVYTANLDSVGVSAYHGAPALENVTGSLSGGLEGGELRLDTRDFSLHLSTLFPEPWRYRTARARLTWALSDNSFTLSSPLMRVSGDEGDASGDIFIRLARKPGVESYMDLRVGLRNADARFAEKYLPTRTPAMSKPLADWLKTAIKAGHIEEGFYQYQGSLMHEAPPGARTMSLFFRVREAQLAYQKGWPALQKAHGDIVIEDNSVNIQVAEGSILDSRVSDMKVSIPLHHDGRTPHLYLNSKLDSSVRDALKILQDTPLPTATIFKGWQGGGDLHGQLDLDLPLGHDQVPKVIVDFSTTNSSLKLSKPRLDINAIQGTFRYDTTQGLSAPDIQAQVFGKAIRGKALAEGTAKGPKTRLVAEGSVSVDRLAQWLELDKRPLPFSGTLPYQIGLTLAEANSEIVVSSPLRGVTIDLPAPFGKPAETAHNGFFRMELNGPEQRYEVTYQGVLDAVLAAPPARFDAVRGEIVLGEGTANLPTERGLRIQGALDRLVLEQWQVALQQYRLQQAPAAADSNAGRPGAWEDALQWLSVGQVKIGRFEGFGQAVDNLEVRLEPLEQGWSLQLGSAIIGGQITVPRNPVDPIEVALKHLSIPASPPVPENTSTVSAPDPLAQIDPHGWPAMDVSIDRFSLGNDPVGAQRFKIRPSSTGVRFSELNLQLRGLKVAGTLDWEGQPQATRTHYVGRLAGENVADVLLAWKFASSVTSQQFRLDADVNWPGSPAWASLNRLSGALDARLDNGQLRQLEGSASALRVFGLLNFEAIRRRLRLDFSDLFGRGLSYDRISALLDAREGAYTTRRPITLEGPSSDMRMNGMLDLANDRVDARLQVGLPVTNSLPIAALIAGAPAIGGALFIVDRLIGDRLTRMASVNYHVHGPWQNPQITLGKPEGQ
ncbi:uncharacterized protein (TIGR02099 family) [Pseudomonas duriflava]|uniref:Uncharacterized protein (TIGR02099 family) n=1 Tax=Pseudomonas duriflava TaxID=459528 RepID=A0A562QF63_9PSED|nr:YhdP family protein [Pseudomonas duriflava]TWI55381.1 uncharacterized protein (TIGR02099 family) [Pseudomonas duriflava]